MKVSLNYDEETGLVEVMTSGGSVTMSKTEVGALYLLLRSVMGFRGRLNLWMHRKAFRRA